MTDREWFYYLPNYDLPNYDRQKGFPYITDGRTCVTNYLKHNRNIIEGALSS